MKFAHIFLFFAMMGLAFLSCGENLGEQRKSNPKDTSVPSFKKSDSSKSLPRRLKDSSIPKKKKPSKLDTLKPRVATLD